MSAAVPKIATVCVLLAGGACQRGGAFDPVPFAAGDATLILVATGPGGSLAHAFAVEDGQASSIITVHDDEQIFALTFKEAIAELGLEPGPIAIVTDGEPFPLGWSKAFKLGVEQEPATWRSATAEELGAVTALELRLKIEVCGCHMLHDAMSCVPCPTDAPVPPLPPAPPALPVLTPCTAGWVERSPASDEIACAPQPRVLCSGGQEQLLGDPGCRTLGTACPSGPFGVVVGPARYVDPMAAAGGDGSELLPYRTLAEALSNALPGDKIALARGTHAIANGTAIGFAIELEGACVAETILQLAGPLSLNVAGVGLSNLTLEGRPLTVANTASVAISDVVARSGSDGIQISGYARITRLVARDLVGTAVRVNVGGSVVIAGLVAERARQALMVNGDGSGAPLSLVRDVWTLSNIERAIVVDGAVLRADRIAIETGTDIGITGRASSRITARDVRIEGARAHAIELNDTDLVLDRASLYGSVSHNFVATGTATVLLSNLISSDSRANGLEIFGAIAPTSRRVLLARNRHFGANFFGYLRVVVEDVTVRGPSTPEADGLVFYAPVTIRRALIEDTKGAAIVFANDGRFEDIDLFRVTDASEESLSSGIDLRYGYARSGLRIRVRDAARGIDIHGGGTEQPNNTCSALRQTFEHVELHPREASAGFRIRCPNTTIRNALIGTYLGSGLDVGDRAEDVSVSDLLVTGESAVRPAVDGLTIDAGKAELVRVEVRHARRGVRLRDRGSLSAVEVFLHDNSTGVEVDDESTERPELDTIVVRDNVQDYRYVPPPPL